MADTRVNLMNGMWLWQLRPPDYALNCRFDPTVNSSSSSFMTETNTCNPSSKRNIIVNTETSNSIKAINIVSQPMFMLDSFTCFEIYFSSDFWIC